jgi:phosphoglycolate phosphatase
MTDRFSRSSDKIKVALLFDLDGTLIDTAEDLAFSVNYMRQKLNLPSMSTREVLNAVGRGAGRLIQETLELDPSDNSLRDSLLMEYRAHYAAHQGTRSRPYPGIEDALTVLQDIADLYVLSNKPTDATCREMDIAHLSHFFKQIWGGGSFAELKPDPMGIHEARRLSRTDAAHTIMIGDLFVDMETASKAGVSSIFVTWGFGRLTDLRHEPSAVADTTADLLPIVRSILKS